MIDSIAKECQISVMNSEIENLSLAGRRAAAQQDWSTVQICADGILKRDQGNAEGMFLLGITEKAAGRPKKAVEAFQAVLSIDDDRYDAAVELASQYSMARRNGDVDDLLSRYQGQLENSPKYLDMAATTFIEIGLPAKAWSLYQKACELQPEISQFRSNLASCSVYVGEIEMAKRLYRELLIEDPTHQRNHYHLARLDRAQDGTHVAQMEQVLETTQLPPDRNIFLHYAMGKEYEDLEQWDEAFKHFKQAGDAAFAIANYDVTDDIAIIDKVIETCDSRWLETAGRPEANEHTPIFVVGLPRTGTTLTERILASHSTVASVGETEFIQMMIRRESNIKSVEKMTPDMLTAVAQKDISIIRNGYLEQIRYRLGEEPFFVDKLPFNILYLGFIAKAWPDRPVVLMKRNAMDTCFSMYKQVFTWAYKYSYNLDTLAKYYVHYERLCDHWRSVLGDRLIEVAYEDIVSDQETQTRRLLERLGLEFEDACLSFEKHTAPSTTASSVQVRQKIHTGSVARWRRYEEQLQALREQLESAGIAVD